MQSPSNSLILPNFFIIGAAKCGTTSLAYYLNQHPDIYIPKDKETHFFDDDLLFEKGIEFYSKYFYANTSRYPARGDATPAYLHYNERVIPRIKAFIPERSHKFIVILRDPVARALSHYKHKVKINDEKLSFKEALNVEAQRLAANPYKWEGYFHDGLYAEQLKKWFDAFDRSSFVVIFQHDFALKTQLFLKNIFEFLNVDPSFKIPDLSRKNEAGIPRWKFLMDLLSTPTVFSKVYSNLVSSHLRRRIRKKIIMFNTKKEKGPELQDDSILIELKNRYKEDVQELEKMLDVELSEWYTD